MTLPNCLVIGAMKSGTTSLWSDLRRTPGVICSSDKEPADLCSDQVLTDDGLRAYKAKFGPKGEAAVVADCSTFYTKMPELPGVPARAIDVLGSSIKIIYVMRDPVDRLVSQHRHEWTVRKCAEPLDQALRIENRFVNYSRYAMQLDLWASTFARSQFLLLNFDTYRVNPDAVRAQIGEFLALDRPIAAGDPNERNDVEWKAPVNGLSYRLSRSPLYRATVRPLLSSSLRKRFKSVSRSLERAPEVPPHDPRIASSTAQQLREIFTADLHKLEQQWGFVGGWDLDSSLAAITGDADV